MPSRPRTRYATVGENVSVAYQVVGEGPLDLIYLQGYASHVDLNWEWQPLARFLEDLAGLARVIMMDLRGAGESERFPPNEVPPLESLMDDITAVMDAAGSSRAVVYASEECGFVAMPFAATYPDRCAGLVLWAAAPAWSRDDEIAWEWDEETWLAMTERTRAEWGNEDRLREDMAIYNPSLAEVDDAPAFMARLERATATPASIVAMMLRWAHTDVRGVLPSIHVPTLVLGAADDKIEPVDSARYLAEHIPGARVEVLPGVDHMPFGVHRRPIIDAISRFLSRVRAHEASFDRVLATVLFTDLVDSTAMVADLGDHRWREVVERHHATVRSFLRRFRGTEIDTAGDGFFASFDGPARAVGCALAVTEAVGSLGVRVRAGVHTGEVETIDGKVGGMGVVIGARVAALAGASEVLVSRTVKDLVAGSGLVFEDRGEHELKGVPDPWQLYRALPADQPTRVSGA